MFAWGYNGSGQLGIGNTINQQSPTKVTGLANIIIVKVCNLNLATFQAELVTEVFISRGGKNKL